MWFVYVLLCEGGSLYTGVSNDVERRLLAHQLGNGAKYTKGHKPITIVYREACVNRSTAQKREAEIKSWSRQQKLQRLQITLPTPVLHH